MTFAKMIAKLPADSWRTSHPFSPELAAANDRLWSCVNDDSEAQRVLSEWLQRYQPCLFGKIAAKLGLLSYCILTDADLERPLDDVRIKIQKARLAWTAAAYRGNKSGIVVLLVSRSLSEARPSLRVLEIAKMLCALYLDREIDVDRVLLDDINLESPSYDRKTWRWDVGVNYFSPHADGRWWNDHRIPGGIALSSNSVGHMVKSWKTRKGISELEKLLGETEAEWKDSKVDSLGKALEFAMRTINGASDTVSGKATELLPMPSRKSMLPRCPIVLPPILESKNYCEYRGKYHTDTTLPSEYFRPAVVRPKDLDIHTLDFTYLFHKAAKNPAFFTMGEGRQIRADRKLAKGSVGSSKVRRVRPALVNIKSNSRLVEALSRLS